MMEKKNWNLWKVADAQHHTETASQHTNNRLERMINEKLRRAYGV